MWHDLFPMQTGFVYKIQCTQLVTGRVYLKLALLAKTLMWKTFLLLDPKTSRTFLFYDGRGARECLLSLTVDGHIDLE